MTDYSVCHGKKCYVRPHILEPGMFVLFLDDGTEVAKSTHPRTLSTQALDADALEVAHRYDLKLDREFQ